MDQQTNPDYSCVSIDGPTNQSWLFMCVYWWTNKPILIIHVCLLMDQQTNPDYS